jgi:hypothetical protein
VALLAFTCFDGSPHVPNLCLSSKKNKINDFYISNRWFAHRSATSAHNADKSPRFALFTVLHSNRIRTVAVEVALCWVEQRRPSQTVFSQAYSRFHSGGCGIFRATRQRRGVNFNA